MQSQSLWCVAGRVLLAHKAGYVCALLVLVTGCATFDQRAGFSDVSATVEARSGKRVVWNLGTELDAQVAQEVRALLQDTLTVDGAVQVALLNNRDLQALYAELGRRPGRSGAGRAAEKPGVRRRGPLPAQRRPG